MIIDDKSVIPKYFQLKEILVNYMLENDFKDGDKLPSENALVKQFDVSRNTVRQAFDTLEKEGTVYKIQGKGTFFKEKPEENPQPTMLIGVISPVTSRYIYSEIIHGAEEYAHERNYHIIIGNSNADPEKERESLESMLEKGIDGLIIEPALSANIHPGSYIFEKLRSLSVPAVLIDCVIDNLDIPCITLDDTGVGYRAARYLLQHNHRRIGIIYKREVIAAELRLEGYKKALDEAGVPVDSALVCGFPEIEEKEGSEPQRRHTEALLQLDDPPTAIFYYNDESAFLGIRAIKKAGLNIPEDISVISVDDIDYSKFSDVPLTTFAHPKQNLGTMAAELLLKLIDSPASINVERRLLTPRLVERSSVASLA